MNLGLRVVGRRPDGYHLLESVFVPIDLADRLILTAAPAQVPQVRLELDDPAAILGLTKPDENLAVRAARRFLAATGIRAEIELRLVKRVPAGAGLGGGSSDAGAVLRGLRDLWPDALEPAALAELALGLGADVPYFLDPRPAWVEGVGERTTPLADFPPADLVLLTPSPPLATAEVFRRYAARRPDALTPPNAGRSMRAPGDGGRAVAALLRAVGGPSRLGASPGAPHEWGGALHNDLEEVASELRPEIRGLQKELRARGARWAALSGSGPTVFGIFSGSAAAQAAASAPWRTGIRVHVARTWSGLTAGAEKPKV